MKIETNDLFDRRIDVYFYDAKKLQGFIKCPETGMKPKIKFQGKIIYTGVAISCTLTITNLSSLIDPNTVKFLKIEMYYGENTRQKGTIILQSLWADNSKEPPERDVTFHCLPAGQSLEIVNSANYTVSLAKQEGGWTVDDAFQQIIDAYNSALTDIQGQSLMPAEIANSLQLSSEIRYSTASLKSIKILIDKSQEKIYNMIEELKSIPLDGDNDQRLTVTIVSGVADENVLIVGTRQVSATRAYAEKYAAEGAKDIFELKYVKNATRQGPVVAVTMLYDPRLTIGQWCSIDPAILTAKRAGGKLVIDAKVGKPLKFQTVGDISVTFSTIDENTMVIESGVIFGET